MQSCVLVTRGVAVFSGLPDMVLPAPPSHLPDQDEVADYLERYAERFDLPVRPQTTVRSLRRNAKGFAISTDQVALEAENVIVAMGVLQRPHIPPVSARLDRSIHQIHSSQYRNPFDLPDGPVLVAGAGSSGTLLATEIARFHNVWVADRDTGNWPRQIFDRDLFYWMWPVMKRATRDTRFLARGFANDRRAEVTLALASRSALCQTSALLVLGA